MNPDRLHLSWDKEQNALEIERITESLQTHFPEYRFLVRLALTQPKPGRSQVEMIFYTEGKDEDRKICTIRHIIGSYLSIQNIVAAVRTVLSPPPRGEG